jgi:hypothetical protein
MVAVADVDDRLVEQLELALGQRSPIEWFSG